MLQRCFQPCGLSRPVITGSFLKASNSWGHSIKLPEATQQGKDKKSGKGKEMEERKEKEGEKEKEKK